jgi:hypothetical protein
MAPKAGTITTDVCAGRLLPPPHAANNETAPAAPKMVRRSIVMAKPQKMIKVIINAVVSTKQEFLSSSQPFAPSASQLS